MTDDELVSELEAQRNLMVAVATGGPRIESVNPEYVKRRATIARELRTRQLDDPNPYGDLWAWYKRWSAGDLGSWASRRAHLGELYQPLIDSVLAGPSATPVSKVKPAQGSSDASLNPGDMAVPQAFVSYSHDSPAHKRWVLELAQRLCSAGVDVILDQWDLKPGMDIPTFMERSMGAASRVVVVLTEEYVRKADTRKGGAGYETVLMTAEILENLDTARFIPIVRQNSSPTLPRGFGARLYVDFSADAQFEPSFELLVRELHAAPALLKPPLGSNPFGNEHRAASASTTVRSQEERWYDLLTKAQNERLQVELETPVLLEVQVDGGLRMHVDAPIVGHVAVRMVESGLFVLGIPIRDRSGITVIATPFTVVENIWMGTEYHLHIALRKRLLIKDGSSSFI